MLGADSAPRRMLSGVQVTCRDTEEAARGSLREPKRLRLPGEPGRDHDGHRATVSSRVVGDRHLPVSSPGTGDRGRGSSYEDMRGAATAGGRGPEAATPSAVAAATAAVVRESAATASEALRGSPRPRRTRREAGGRPAHRRRDRVEEAGRGDRPAIPATAGEVREPPGANAAAWDNPTARRQVREAVGLDCLGERADGVRCAADHRLRVCNAESDGWHGGSLCSRRLPCQPN
jgi:hypothetical protein